MKRSNIYILASIIGVLALSSVQAMAQIRSEMRLFSDSFISSSFEATQKTNYQYVGANLKTDDKSDDPIVVDISGAVAIGSPILNYLNFSEAYFESQIDPEQKLTVGRRKMSWNQLDARWQMGIWEPIFKWNPLSPERQGLTGIFWEVQRPQFALTLFASPLYVPDQGPGYDIQNGEFVRSNPWFTRPPDSLHIFGETTQIEYRLQKPEDSEIVLQTSYGAKIRFGDEKSWLLQLSQIYKPSNQLAMGYDGVLDIPRDRGVVDIQPQVFYHSVSGVDFIYRTSIWKLGTSFVLDRPNQDKIFDEKWTHPVFENAFLSTFFAEMNTRFIDVYVQRLDSTGGEIKEEGALADPRRRPLMTRYRFRQANELGVSAKVALPRKKLFRASLSYLQSDQNDFSMLKVNSRFHLSAYWSLYGEAQLLEARSLSSDNQNEIAQYANNDRLMIGTAYVF